MLKTENHPVTDVGLASQLFDALNQHEIVYCHWKGNELLDAGLKGETDLDVLVDRASFTLTVTHLLRFGFKQATARWGPGTPGVLHFYGFDPVASELIHVHLHSHVLTGEGLVETHLLPCESMLLQNCSHIGRVRVPSIEAEAALGLLRKFIKKGSLFHMMLHGKHHGSNERDELLFPDDVEAAKAAYQALDDCFRAIDHDLFMDCYRALVEDAPASKQWWLGLKVRSRLSGCKRYTFFGRLLAYASVILVKLGRVARGNIKNKVLDSGGAVVAFIGGDATGKSTLIAETRRWLSGNLTVRTMHTGKPPSTWLTAPLRVLMPMARCLFPNQRHQAKQAEDDAAQQETSCGEKSEKPTSLLYAIRAVSLAWERSRLLRRVHRLAAMGEIVICDRYPSDMTGATDGPRLQVRDGKRGWRATLCNWLARYEQRLYEQNAPPTVALRLNVSLETAKRRNQRREKADKHSDRDLEIRHQQRRAWKKTGTKVVYEINTEASLEQTVLSVKQTIWESL